MVTVVVVFKDSKTEKFDIKDFGYCNIDYSKEIWQFDDMDGIHREYGFHEIEEMRFMEP